MERLTVSFKKNWGEMDYLNGKEVKVQNGKETFSGTAGDRQSW